MNKCTNLLQEQLGSAPPHLPSAPEAPAGEESDEEDPEEGGGIAEVDASGMHFEGDIPEGHRQLVEDRGLG